MEKLNSNIKLYIILIIFILTQNIVFSQFDLKLEHTYDSLIVNRIKLPKSGLIRYISREYLYDSLKNIKDINYGKVRIYDENHRILKTIESKYKIEKDQQTVFADYFISYHSEDKNGKILFNEMTKYPYDFRIIDEDGNIAHRDSTVDFEIDSTDGLTPKAVKLIALPSSKVAVQYYSYPSFVFEKEYIIDGVGINDYQTKIFRKKFDSIGEKIILSTDTAIYFFNNNHSLWKTIKPFVPLGYVFFASTLNVSQKQINIDLDLELNYEVLQSSQYGGCYTTQIKTLLTTENAKLLYERDYTQTIGPPEKNCNQYPTSGCFFELQGKQLIQRCTYLSGTHEIINTKNFQVMYRISDSIGYFQFVNKIGKSIDLYGLIRIDSILFFNDDNEFKFKFKTKDRFLYIFSDTIFNNDNFIEWLSPQQNGGIVIKNENDKILFQCAKCYDFSLSKINGKSNKLLLSESINPGFTRTLVYSKNVSTHLKEEQKIVNLLIYPNPAYDIVKIDMTLDEYGDLDKYTLRVVDIVGRVQSWYPLSNFASVKEISVAGLANGLYFVQLVDKGGRVTAHSKVVVAH